MLFLIQRLYTLANWRKVMQTEYEERFDDIEVMLGRLILENDRMQRRQERSFIRLEELIAASEKRAEVDRQRAEEDRKRADADRQRAEEDRKRAEADRQRAEEDRKRAETDRQRAEEDRKRAEEDRKNWNKKWGELSDKLGTIVEDIVAPNIPRIAKELCQCDEVDDLMVRRWVRNKKDRSKRREFDVIAVCGDYVILNETKSTVRIDYINQFIEVLPEVTDYFPEYENKTIIPVFSSLGIREDMVNYLTKHHIYALAMGDETMELLNNHQF